MSLDDYVCTGLDGMTRAADSGNKVVWFLLCAAERVVVFCFMCFVALFVFPFWCLEKLCTIVSR